VAAVGVRHVQGGPSLELNSSPDRRMTRILSIYYRPKPGGFCKRLAMAYEAFAERGWEVHYLSIEKFPLDHPLIHHHPIPMLFRKREHLAFWLNFFLIAPVLLFQLRLRFPAEAIVVFGPAYSFIAAPCRLFKNTKIVLFSRGELLESLRETHRGALRALLLAGYGFVRRIGIEAADAVIFNSASQVRKSRDEFPANKNAFFLLPNDIPPPKKIPKAEAREALKAEFRLPDQAFILLSVGRLHPGKNYEFLLDIFRKAQERMAPGRLVLFIVGDDPRTGEAEKTKLRSRADSWGLADVFLTGWRNDLEVFYSAADVFLLTSRHEGSPNSLLEAIGHDLPSFGSDIEEIRDILEPDVFRFSLDEYGLEKVSSSIVQIRRDPAYRDELQSKLSSVRKRMAFDWPSELCRMVERIL
jgi:glycosyltransferase involved in cell wall biosynthesis